MYAIRSYYAAIGLQEERAEHVDHRRADHQVRAPRVNGADEPAERHLRHDELNALVGLRRRRSIVEQQQDAREDLNHEKEQSYNFV